MEVFITEPAEKSLQHIFRFYVEQASEDIALKVTDKIINRIESLDHLANRGRTEFYLSELKQGHRYILEGNFKIIYLVGPDKVIVTDIFDTRQDPDEIIKRAK